LAEELVCSISSLNDFLAATGINFDAIINVEKLEGTRPASDIVSYNLNLADDFVDNQVFSTNSDFKFF
jgi:hypothetical protein